MDLFGIGLPELLFILLIILLIFGPKDLEKTSKSIGRSVYRFLNSDSWKAVRRVRDLPAEIVRQAGLDEFHQASDQAGKAAAPGGSQPHPGSSVPEPRIEPHAPRQDEV